jgi:hypothetical protein
MNHYQQPHIFLFEFLNALCTVSVKHFYSVEVGATAIENNPILE